MIERKIENYGLRWKHSGSWYLKMCVEYIIESGDPTAALTKEIYPEIGKKYGVDWRCVERSIRYAIKSAGLDMKPGDLIFKIVMEVLKSENRIPAAERG
jgi:hypothetical protein